MGMKTGTKANLSVTSTKYPVLQRGMLRTGIDVVAAKVKEQAAEGLHQWMLTLAEAEKHVKVYRARRFLETTYPGICPVGIAGPQLTIMPFYNGHSAAEFAPGMSELGTRDRVVFYGPMNVTSENASHEMYHWLEKQVGILDAVTSLKFAKAYPSAETDPPTSLLSQEQWSAKLDFLCDTGIEAGAYLHGAYSQLAGSGSGRTNVDMVSGLLSMEGWRDIKLLRSKVLPAIYVPEISLSYMSAVERSYAASGFIYKRAAPMTVALIYLAENGFDIQKTLVALLQRPEIIMARIKEIGWKQASEYLEGYGKYLRT